MLGLAATKGHLGPGADADVTLYSPDADCARMFALPRYVLKGGEVVVEGGDIRIAGDRAYAARDPEHVAPPYRPAEIEAGVGEATSTGKGQIQFANYPVAIDEVANPLPCVRANGETP